MDLFHWRIQEGAIDVRPLSVQILSFSYSFRQKIMQNIRLEHPTWALAAPGNPESATTLSPIYLIFGKHVFF